MHDLMRVSAEGLAFTHTVPGVVSAVITAQVSDEVVLVDWTAPDTINGILQQYVLVYREYSSSSTEVEINVPLPATSYNVSGLSESNNSQLLTHSRRAYACCECTYVHTHVCTVCYSSCIALVMHGPQ